MWQARIIMLLSTGELPGCATEEADQSSPDPAQESIELISTHFPNNHNFPHAMFSC